MQNGQIHAYFIDTYETIHQNEKLELFIVTVAGHMQNMNRTGFKLCKFPVVARGIHGPCCDSIHLNESVTHKMSSVYFRGSRIFQLPTLYDPFYHILVLGLNNKCLKNQNIYILITTAHS